MTHPACSQIVDATLAHLTGQFEIREAGEDCLVITPFIDAERASVEIFIKQNGNEYLLSDEGNVSHQLFANGLTVEENPELIRQIVTIAHTREVDFRNSALFTRTAAETIGEAVQNLASAIQAASFLIYKETHRQRFSFTEEVEQFLIAQRIRYEYKYALRGLANTHTIPFYFNSTRNLLLEPISADSVSSARNKAKSVAYIWSDLKNQYGQRYRYVVVLDDQKNRQREAWNDPEAMSALQNYSTHVMFWTEDQPQLAAMLSESTSAK